MNESTFGLTVEQPTWENPASGERRKRSRARVPALTLLYHPDLTRVGERVLLSGLLNGRTARLSRLEPDFEPPGQFLPRPLGDRHISRSPVLLSRSGEDGGLHLSVAETRTRVTANGVPVQEGAAFPGSEVQRGIVLELADRVVLLLHTLPAHLAPPPEHFGLVGESEGILRLRYEVRRVADLEVPVLLRGETGTGKELVARAIHQASQRRGGPCLCVNMGAIPPSLAASELFGAARGAFTGSVRDQAGYFQRASGGTLFLDEIGEAPPEVQVMLLRVLETGEVQRVGGSEPSRVDVRLIAATDANLEQAIEDGRFRAPLLHRLAGYEIVVPPLRERRDDFGRLLFHFLREELRATGEEHRLLPAEEGASPWMPASVVARLARYGWPGNVRQLRNAARQMVIASRAAESVQIGPQIEKLLREASSMPPPPSGPAQAWAPPPEPAPVRRRAEPQPYRSPAEVGEQEILEALRACRWEMKPAAERLGVSRPSLYLLAEKYPSIRKAVDLTRAEILEAKELCHGDLDAMVDRLEVSRRGLQQRMAQLGIG